MRKIAVVTGTRADFGIYRPVLRAIRSSPALNLRLMVCGAHLSARFGNTVDEIVTDGFEPAERLDTLEDDDSPASIARSMANGLRLFGEAYARALPDILLVLGDRYEMFAAAAAALPFNIPIAHIHGGETTQGAMDDSLRHAITMMSTFHFTATEAYAERIRRMGQPADRVFVSGAPGLQNITTGEDMSEHDLEALLGLPLKPAPLLVTFHPVTREVEDTAWHIDELLAALAGADRPVIITYPNADTAHNTIIEQIHTFAQSRSDVALVRNLGTRAYLSLMRRAAAMVGNSSSGIIEAASFKLPVVNIGSRQRGRTRGVNVIDCGHGRSDIAAALVKALSPTFRDGLKSLVNPYADGDAAGLIAEKLATLPLERDRYGEIPSRAAERVSR